MRKALLFLPLLIALVFVHVSRAPALRSCVFDASDPGSGIGVSALSAAISCISAADLLLAVFGLAAAGLVVYALLTIAAFKKRATLAGLLIFLAAALSFYLAPGEVRLGDAALFSSLTVAYADAFSSLQLPLSSFAWYGGSLFMWFYGPLFYVAAGALTAITGSLDLTVKLLLYAAHLGSAAAMFALASRHTKTVYPALVAALIYTLSFEHIARIMIVGRWTDSLTYLLLPLAFLALERLMEQQTLRRLLALVALHVALFLANPLDALYLLPFVWLYGLLRYRLAIAKPALLTASASLALLAFWLLPFFSDARFVSGGARIVQIFALWLPAPADVAHMLFWPGYWGATHLYYLGITALALAALGLRRNRALSLAAASALLIALFNSWRAAPALVLLIALLAAYGTPAALSFFKRYARSAAPTVLLLILLVDLMPATIQPVYADFSEQSALFTEAAVDDSTLLDLHTNRRTYFNYVPYVATQRPVLFGSILEGAPRSTAYTLPLAQQAAREYYDLNQSFSEPVLDGLYLFNVRHVLLHNEQVGQDVAQSFTSKRAGFGLEKNLSLLSLDSSPLVASATLAVVEGVPHSAQVDYFSSRANFEQRTLDWPFVEQMLESMDLNRSSATASALLVRAAPETTGAQDLTVTVHDFSIAHTRASYDVELSADAFVQLPLAHFPWLSATIDGAPAQMRTSAMETIIVRVPQGRHALEINAGISPLRKAGLLVSALSILALLILSRRLHKI